MEAFVRVIRAGSFSGAARQWYRSKAAVSKYISTLEEDLGVELLHRTTRSLHLTAAGETYLRHCHAVLEQIEAVEASLSEAVEQPKGILRVTASPGLAAHYGPALTSDFHALYPGLRLELNLTYRLVDMVQEGVDVAIRLTNHEDPALVSRALAPAPIVAVASPEFLRRCGTPRRPADLRRQPCIVDTNFPGRGDWLFTADTGEGTQTVEVDGPFRVNNPQVVRDLALAGHGVGLVTRFLVAEQLSCGSLVEVLPGRVALSWTIYALHPRRRYVPRRVQVYIDHLTTCIESSPGLAAPV